MHKKIFFISLALILFFSFLSLTVNSQIVHAQNVTDALTGLNQTANTVPAFKSQTAAKTNFGTSFLASYAGRIIGVVLSFVGVIFLGLMIYAGLMWMLAEGNEQEVTKAKDLITSAIIGLIIVFAAYALTAFIGQKFL